MSPRHTEEGHRGIAVSHRMALPHVVPVITSLSWSAVLGANTCMAVPPPKGSGPLCGRMLDPGGAAVPDSELRMLDTTGSVVARARADAQGDFRFPPVSKGRYRLTTTAKGFL